MLVQVQNLPLLGFTVNDTKGYKSETFKSGSSGYIQCKGKYDITETHRTSHTDTGSSQLRAWCWPSRCP